MRNKRDKLIAILNGGLIEDSPTGVDALESWGTLPSILPSYETRKKHLGHLNCEQQKKLPQACWGDEEVETWTDGKIKY